MLEFIPEKWSKLVKSLSRPEPCSSNKLSSLLLLGILEGGAHLGFFVTSWDPEFVEVAHSAVFSRAIFEPGFDETVDVPGGDL